MKNEARILAIDPGNFQIKALHTGGEVRVFRSIHADLENASQRFKGTEDSPILEFAEGNRKVAYHLGETAAHYEFAQHTVNEVNKAELTRLHFYAANPYRSGNIKVVINNHSPQVTAPAIQKALKGAHTYKRNGEEYSVQVEAVQVVNEGLGSIALAAQMEPSILTKTVLVIDVGAGTWNAALRLPTGDMISRSAQDTKGAKFLADAIVADAEFKALALTKGIRNPDPHKVLEAFANGNRYGQTGIDLKPWIDKYLSQWVKTMLQESSAQYAKYQADISKIVLTGGGAYLLQDFPMFQNAMFLVLPDPNLANVRGMLTWATHKKDAFVAA